MTIHIKVVELTSTDFAKVITVATRLAQAKYITRTDDYYDQAIPLGAFEAEHCVGIHVTTPPLYQSFLP